MMPKSPWKTWLSLLNKPCFWIGADKLKVAFQLSAPIILVIPPLQCLTKCPILNKKHDLETPNIPFFFCYSLILLLLDVQLNFFI